MSDHQKQVARVAAMVAGGAVLGAGLGLLFAPQTGSATRRDISRYAKKAQIQAIRWSRSVQSGVKAVVDRSRELTPHAGPKPMIEAA